MYIEETQEQWDTIQKIQDKDERNQKEIEFFKRVDTQTEYWSNLKKQLSTLVEERTSFITTETFYPRDYATRLTTLEVFLENIEEYIQKNPLKQNDKIEKAIQEEIGKVAAFSDMKEKVVTMLPKLNAYEQTLDSEKKKYDYFLKKQDLILALQKGDLDQVKRLLKYFRPKAQD